MSTERWMPDELLPKTKTHYSNPGKVEPIDLIDALNLDFFEGNIIKYVCRHRKKDGLRDLQKARQYLDWLIIRTEREQACSRTESKGVDAQPMSAHKWQEFQASCRHTFKWISDECGSCTHCGIKTDKEGKLEFTKPPCSTDESKTCDKRGHLYKLQDKKTQTYICEDCGHIEHSISKK